VIDLCRDDYSVVVVDRGGWRVVKPSPLALRRAPGMLPLSLPEQGAGPALDDLRILLGFDGADCDAFWPLFVGFLFSCLRPAGPYFVFVLVGEQGSGKTTTVRIMRMPIDPHDTDLQPKPRTEDDLFVNADGQWLTAYDNLSSLDQHWSDAFCRIATGTGYSKRKLYTDRETTRFRVARPQAITSIVDVAGAPDLLDRSLLAPMPEVDAHADEEELLAAAAALAPRVLGQLLDAAVIAFNRQKAVKLHTVPRMVGPTKWVEAAAEVLGLAPGQFLDTYLDSQSHAGEMALESSLIGMPLVDMLAARAAWAALAEREGNYYAGPVGFEGTAKELLKDLSEYQRDKPGGLASGWPRTPRGMSAALRRIAPALRKLGYVVDFARMPGTGARVIRVSTPLSLHAADSVHDATNRHDRHDRHSGGMVRDGRDGRDGRIHTQTNVEGTRTARPNGPAASAPFMITRRMRDALHARGFTDEQIREMTPQQAHWHLATPERTAK
jgi:hypothetical protein